MACPACGSSVLLELVADQTSGSQPAMIEDPFADIAESKTSSASERSAGPSSKIPLNAKPKRKKKPAENQPDELAPEGSDNESDALPDGLMSDQYSPGEYSPGEYSPGEPYIDELGLGELSELRQEDWSSPDALPPVQKRLIKKQKRTAEVLESADPQPSAVAKPVSKSRGFEEPESLSGRRWLTYAVFFLTLLPLAVVILIPNGNDLESSVAESGEAVDEGGGLGDEAAEIDVAPGGQEQAEGTLDDWAAEDDEPFGVDEFIRALPDQRLPGALLSRDSSVHWIFAGLSGVAFTGLFLALFRRYKDAIGGALVGALFTATLGIVLLLGLQAAAFASSGIRVRSFGRRGGIIALLFLVVHLIGFSYRCALEPGAGFMSSFMGFTLGVGICEEVCKILPVIVFLGTAKKATWQGACLVGLASGVGFGVSEGIMYSSNYYNGISGAEIYLVRFTSCVSLHAVWTGAGAVLLYFNQETLHSEWTDIITIIALTLGIPIVMHGLYDTLLKQDMPVWALLVGIGSVAWLIGVVEKQTQDEVA